MNEDLLIKCLLKLWIEETVIKVEKISKIPKSPCKKVNVYAIDFDAFKESRKVSVGKGEKLKQPPSCDALIIEIEGRLIFIEFKRIKELVVHAFNESSEIENVCERVRNFNFKDKMYFSFFIFQELVRGYDSGKLKNFIERNQGRTIPMSISISKLFNVDADSIEYYIITEDKEHVVKLWGSLAARANLPLKGYVEEVYKELSRVANNISQELPYTVRVRTCNFISQKWKNSLIQQVMEEENYGRKE